MITNNISTPIFDFVKAYADRNEVRLHMPGHKGQAFLGFEQFDITEISGADSLYEADGIINESEQNATELFGTGRTVYSTQGSSQAICAMLYLAVTHAKENEANHTNNCDEDKKPVVIAARNVHKSFIHAATLLDFDIVWLWPEQVTDSICSCPISDAQVEKAILEYADRVAAVYMTTPDYLGGMQDVKKIADVCHKYNVILAVDNAHGAYLHFLERSLHPMDLGADICCDSAHKTLPVLTGGAYLHISKKAPKIFLEQAKYAMSLFGSTSPSYLTMTSLDVCNSYLADDYCSKLKETVFKIAQAKEALSKAGWEIMKSDPLKLVVKIQHSDVKEVTDRLQNGKVVWEYADKDYIVFMLTPENNDADLERLILALGNYNQEMITKNSPIVSHTEQLMSIREAMFLPGETVSLERAEGRVCRVPTVSCPPAIPIAVPGEMITKEMIQVFQYYGINKIDVVNE